jgi:hypothetical protein
LESEIGISLYTFPSLYIEIQKVNFTELDEELGEGHFWKKLQIENSAFWTISHKILLFLLKKKLY